MALEDAYELAYREAVRALDHQRAAVTELRSRAGMLLATASITVSLLGQDAFRGMRPFAWLAVSCFTLLSVCVLAIVWPDADWSVDADPQALLGAHLSTETTLAAALSLDFIAHHARHREANARRLAHVARMFRIGACLLAIQILSTIAAASTAV
jgi:hypothetical protein